MPTPTETPSERAAREHRELLEKQTLAARERRLRKRAQKDPAVEDLYTERTALAATVATLRARLAEVDAKHASLATEASRLTEDNVHLRQQLAAETETSRRLADENGTLRQQLAAALSKAKPGKS